MVFLFVTLSFLGLGLLIAALANDVPAVQALRQCVFLPMIMIGGGGVPLAVLPAWVQRAAGFMPGRCGVDALQSGFGELHGLRDAGFSLVALTVIGAAAGVVGVRRFRWDASRHVGRSAWPGIAVALLSWIAVGVVAAAKGRSEPVLPAGAVWASIPDAQIDSISFQDVPGDHEFVTPLAPPLKSPADARAVGLFAARLQSWAPGRLDDAGQSIRDLVGVAAIADLIRDSREAEIARAVFDELRAQSDQDQLRRARAWIILATDEGSVATNAPELVFGRHPPEGTVRSRNALYAQKYLGRVVRKISDP